MAHGIQLPVLQDTPMTLEATPRKEKVFVLTGAVAIEEWVTLDVTAPPDGLGWNIEQSPATNDLATVVGVALEAGVAGGAIRVCVQGACVARVNAAIAAAGVALRSDAVAGQAIEAANTDLNIIGVTLESEPGTGLEGTPADPDPPGPGLPTGVNRARVYVKTGA